ncbi:MAG TPA: hypothetical protein VFV87_04540 [Pirellulaceae bacterium]|nr:hypothetical protein [Pirellulaceae bacterium]
MPRLSILIPCVGGAAEFDATLVSVLQHRPDDCEVLVIHTEPYSDPYDLGAEVQFLRSARDAKRTELINEGLAAATGEIVHLLGCGAEATEAWAQPALDRFHDPEVAAVAPLVMDTTGGKLLAAGVRWTLGGSRRIVADQRIKLGGSARLRAGILGPTLEAGFFRRDALQALNGFDTRMDERLADVDLALSLAALDLQTVCEPASRVLLSSTQADACPFGFTSGWSAERLFWRHAAPRGLLASLAFHPLTLIGDALRTRSLAGTLAAGLGRLAAWLEIGSSARYQKRLAVARHRLAETNEPTTIRLAEPAKVAIAKRRAA